MIINEIENIFDNYDRSEWINIIKSLDYQEKDGQIMITLNNEKEYIHSSLEELSMDTFPFEIGDIVTHKSLGGEFIIYDYPILDKRKDISYYTKNKCFGLYVANDPLFYKVDGYINGNPYGFELTRDINGIEATSLYEDDCYWKNWIKIGNIKDDKYKNNKKFQRILQYYEQLKQ